MTYTYRGVFMFVSACCTLFCPAFVHQVNFCLSSTPRSKCHLLCQPSPPPGELISPSSKLPVGPIHTSFVADDRVHAACYMWFCFKYLCHTTQ